MTAPLRYAFRPRPFTAETTLELTRDMLVANRAGRETSIPYREIATIRLFYAPRGINFSGFRAKIYTRNGKTVSFEDRSYKSLVEQERLEGPYRMFVEALVARTAAANPDVLLHAGKIAPMLALVALVGAVTLALLAYFGFRALTAGQYGTALGVAVFVGYFSLWTWQFTIRNRPRTFNARAIPADILPAAGAGAGRT